MMASDLHEALKCAERALTLARDLDQVRSPGDLRQVAGGLQTELNCVVQSLSDGLDALRTTATGDRPGKERSDARATSQRSAEAITVKSGTQRSAVLLALYDWGDLTDYEIQERLEMDQNSERPRRGELVDGEFVAPALLGDGRPVTKRHRDRDWQVWTLTMLGLSIAVDLRVEKSPTESIETNSPPSLF